MKFVWSKTIEHIEKKTYMKIIGLWLRRLFYLICELELHVLYAELTGCCVFYFLYFQEPTKQTIRDLATDLLILPTLPSVQQFTKTLLATVQPSNQAYHNHKVWRYIKSLYMYMYYM